MRTRWRLAGATALLAWCAIVLALRRPAAITDDWQGWRQADTQAIARNLAFEEFSPLAPRIDWRGDGPGYVETELQLYPTLIALALRVTGESEWPGQLLSLACVAGALAIVALALARRYGEVPAFVALLAMLGHQGTIAMSTSIQPDSLALLAFAIGFVAFVDYLDRANRSVLVVWVVATAIAGLVKPTTLELGIAQFVLAAGARRLRDRAIWIGWFAIIAVVGAFLAYAHTLYTDHGNTFGVLAGGDSKLPALSALADPQIAFDLVRYSIMWGIGVPGVAAALYLALRRKLSREHVALGLGALVLVVLALRYTSGPFGTHYHLPHVVLGGWLVAAAAVELLPRFGTRIVVAVAAIAALGLGVRGLHFLRARSPEPETELGERLARVAPPGTLVAVRARAESYNLEWKTVNNFEDPRVFYVSHTHGWAVANDVAGAARLDELAHRGARFYVHVHQKPIDAELAAWLAAHATLVDQSPAGELYRLSVVQ